MKDRENLKLSARKPFLKRSVAYTPNLQTPILGFSHSDPSSLFKEIFMYSLTFSQEGNTVGCSLEKQNLQKIMQEANDSFECMKKIRDELHQAYDELMR